MMAKIPKGKTVKKACPECAGDLVIRQNRTTQQHFLGCIDLWRNSAATRNASTRSPCPKTSK